MHRHPIFAALMVGSILSCTEIQAATAHVIGNARVARGASPKIWPDSTVPVVFPTKDFEVKVNEALQEISSNTCIEFVERDRDKDYVQFVGRRRSRCMTPHFGLHRGRHTILLGLQCATKGTVLREVMRVLGVRRNEDSTADTITTDEVDEINNLYECVIAETEMPEASTEVPETEVLCTDSFPFCKDLPDLDMKCAGLSDHCCATCDAHLKSKSLSRAMTLISSIKSPTGELVRNVDSIAKGGSKDLGGTLGLTLDVVLAGLRGAGA